MFQSVQPTDLPLELRWRYVPVEGGETLHAWIVGPPVGVKVHWSDYSKPCRHAITGGKLKCPLGPNCSPRFICYVPLLEVKRREQIVIIASKSVFPTVASFAHGSPVEIARPKSKNNPPLRITSVNPDTVGGMSSKNVAKRKPEDIRPYLLHLWQDRILCEHCEQTFIPSAATDEEARGIPRVKKGV